MAERLTMPKQQILDRQKLEQKSVEYSLYASRSEVRILIQAPPLEGQIRDRKY